MFNISRYIEKGSVKRDRIVADIKKCRISKNDIFELDKNPEVSSAYFATGKFKNMIEVNGTRIIWMNFHWLL